MPAWQTAAGGRTEFEVASIHRSEPGTFQHPDMVLNNEDTPGPPGGHFLADFPLEIFIEFAYKIMPTREQEDAMLAHLPRWVSTDHFVIQAQAAGAPTKDQVRLMMQSLLADRFKLSVHFETKVVPSVGNGIGQAGEDRAEASPSCRGARVRRQNRIAFRSEFPVGAARCVSAFLRPGSGGRRAQPYGFARGTKYQP
ncbi:MAG: TIGR03435 family protein [Terracidiphilus sp.]|jgi:uncharacterized protein (TIGR03435 family)